MIVRMISSTRASVASETAPIGVVPIKRLTEIDLICSHLMKLTLDRPVSDG
jgi:hypothetical protein